MLVDTDILIDYLRGNPEASQFLESHIDKIHISSMTVAELSQGVADDRENKALESLLSTLEVICSDKSIALEAGLLRRRFRKSHNIGLADCLIAATAIQHQMPLKTLNLKHFPMLADVQAPYQKGR